MILSTHILPEVTQLCDKIVIISRGRIVAEDTTDSLTATEDLEAVFMRVTTGDVADHEEDAAIEAVTEEISEEVESEADDGTDDRPAGGPE